MSPDASTVVADGPYRRETGITVDRFDRFADISPTVWDACVEPGIYVSAPWFRSVEGKFGTGQSYVVAAAGAWPLAAAAFYPTDATTFYFFNPIALLTGDETVKHLSPHVPDADQDDLARLVEIVRDCPADATVCVSPYGYENPLRPAPAAPVRRAILDAFDAAADSWRTPVRSWMYAGADDLELRDELEERGFIAVHAGANCVLVLAGETFDDYLAALPVSRRSAVRKERRRFLEHGLTITRGELSDHIEELAHFQAALQAKYGHGYDLEKERAALRGIDEHLGEYARVNLVWKDKELVGFLLFYEKGQTIYPKMVGQDWSRLKRDDFVYFNATYYDLVTYAYENRIERLEYGIYSYDVKLTRGCRADRLVSYVRVPDEFHEPVTALAAHLGRATERLLSMYEIAPKGEA